MESYREKLTVTLAIYATFFASGVNFNILSPTLKKLAPVFGVDELLVSRIYTLRSAGYLAGSLLGSVLFRSTGRQKSLANLYLLVSICLAIAPLSGNFTAAVILWLINGTATGIVDVKTNVLLCRIWGAKSGPYIQAMYFLFAIGCVVAPLIAAPFIAMNKVVISFVIGGSIVASSSLAIYLSTYVSVVDKDEVESTGGTDDPDGEAPRDANGSFSIVSWFNGILAKFLEWMKDGKNQRITLTVILIALMIMSYSGTEIIYWEFLPSYLTELPMNISAEDASYMAASIKAGLMVSRGLGIVAATFISSKIILTIDLAILFFSCLVLLFLQQSYTMIWIGNLAIASAFATVYPQIYSLVVSKFELNDVIGAIFCFSSSVTAVILPEIVAKGLKDDSNFLIWLVLICIILTGAFFFLATFSMRKINSRTPNGQDFPLEQSQTTNVANEGPVSTDETHEL